uniref:Anoctamin transmembrane domain-containing protein n=1 Tax=Hemiselmis andersenii TaxID=464988 RepID=A0A6T8LEY3_HEMAN|mmetsp:Transcript_9446/g.23171  ORF Transcript_9446/g.23171 Transcript_9446/m.23171 type:complete len:682 (+) Transcript_9446:50-2095(+)
MAGIQKRRQKATRYFTEDDDDDGGATAAATSTMPPAMCAVFKTLDPDEHESAEIEAANQVREKVIGKLRALNLNVDQFNSSDNKFIFVTIGAPETMLKYEAEHQRAKLRLREEYGGALCYYLGELDEKKAYDKPLDGFELFSSTLQLKLIDEVVRSKPYGSNEKDEPIDFDELMADGKVEEYFPLHHSRMRMKLVLEWASLMTKPQPLEMVREYFGEQIALFYTWYGFYNTMLWFPAIVGTLLSTTKVYFGTSDTPWVSMYGILLTLWTVLVCHLWKRLEAQRRYEWDTLEFEEQEVMRTEFMKNPATLRNAHKNEVTGAIDEYYFDEGGYFPPSGRAGRCAVTFGVIFVMDGLSILLSIFIYQHAVHPLLSMEDHMTGSTVGGVLFSATSLLLDRVFSALIARLIEWENWTTETQHEDALIVRSCLFNVVNKYFCLILVAFLINHVPIMGEDLSCPDWQCMPVVHTMLMVHFIATAMMQLAEANLLPYLKKVYTDFKMNASLKKAAGQGAPVKTPMEEALETPPFSGVFDQYSPYVFQFGYIACFTVAFPMGALFALVTNLYQLRMSAKTLVTATQRPPYSCASDIGAWQSVMDIVATASVITNSLIIGITSHSCYFYFPEMTMLQRIWAVIILEHLLFGAKIFIENVIKIEDAEASREYDRKTTMRDFHLKNTFKIELD